MTFEVPKISSAEFKFYQQRTPVNGVQKTPVSFGGKSSGTGAGALKKELDEIAGYGIQKADNTHTYGLYGAPTPDAGTGSKLWTFG